MYAFEALYSVLALHYRFAAITAGRRAAEVAHALNDASFGVNYLGIPKSELLRYYVDGHCGTAPIDRFRFERSIGKGGA